MNRPLVLASHAMAAAERRGFEPRNRFGRLHAFQACLFSHSSISPFLTQKNALRTMHNAFRLQKYLFFIRVAHYLGKNFSLQCPFWCFRLLTATLFGKIRTSRSRLCIFPPPRATHYIYVPTSAALRSQKRSRSACRDVVRVPDMVNRSPSQCAREVHEPAPRAECSS